VLGADLNCSELRHWRSAPKAVQPCEEKHITSAEVPQCTFSARSAVPLRHAFRELSEPALARAIKPGSLGLGRRLTNSLDQLRLDPAAILAGESFAEAVEPLMYLVPNEALLLRDGQRALGKSDEVRHMSLLRLATDLHGLN
jgi:hypothetical protein